MKQREETVRWLVRQWLSKADVDFRVAERLIRDEDPIREAIVFHCQQAVEKYLKAFLVSKQAEFPKTHSLGQLLDLLVGVEPGLAEALAEVESLTPFGVEIRYPGDFPELLPGEERPAFELAKRTRETILARLGT